MKKLTIILLFVLAVIFTLVGCSENTPQYNSGSIAGNSSPQSVVSDSTGSTQSASTDQSTEPDTSKYILSLGEDQVQVTYGKPIGEIPVVPAKTGYTATGWFIGETAVTAETVWSFTENKTAEARYTANKYKLVLGETQIEVTFDKAIGNLPVVPEMAGCVGKWCIGETAITAETIWTYTEDKTATAEYTSNEFKLTLGETKLTVIYGQAVGTLPAIPAKTGYTAKGWYIGETAITAETIWTFTEDKTATAEYNPEEYKLTLGETELTVAYGQAVGTLPAVPARTGYTAKGWYIGETAVTAETVWTYTENKTATAEYTPEEYKLTLGETELTVTYDQAIGDLPAVPEDTEQNIYKGFWMIGETVITAETVWTYAENKTAVAPYRTICDLSATFIADFDLESDADYVVASDDITVGDIEAVKNKGEALTYNVDVNKNEIVFANDYIKGFTYGDYIFDTYTASNVYRIKVAIVTKVINGVEDFPCADAKTLDGYYIVGRDFDASASATSPVSMLHYTGDPRTNTIEANNIMGFNGIFDGRGHVISNLTVKGGGYAFMGGLFGSVQSAAIIRNVAFIDMEAVDGYKFLFTGESCCMKGAIENVVVTTKNSDRLFGFVRASNDSVNGYIRNTVFAGGNYFAFHDMSNDGEEGDRQGDKYKPSSGNVLMATKTAQCESGEVYGATRYATTNAMLNALYEENVIENWNSPYISFKEGSIYFNGVKVVTPVIGLTSSDIEAYVNNTITFTATDAFFSLKTPVDGVSINAMTGELTVGDIPVDTQITIVAKSVIDPAYTEEMTVVVAFLPIDLTEKGVYDVELGQTISIEGVSDDVIAIKGSVGKVALASANVVTASELNSAAGVDCSEELEITVYTASNAYTIRGAFITKIIRTVADLKDVAAYGTANRTAHTGYYILGNDIDGADQDGVKALSYDMPDHDQYKTHGFRGIFDGRGHTLKNLKLQEGMLFWGIGNNGVVKNLALIDPVQLTARDYVLTRNITHGTISNVIVRADSKNAILFTDCGAIIENSVFILDTNGTGIIVQKDDAFGGDIHTPTVLKNVIVVLKNNSGSFNALFGNDYKPSGLPYAEYEAANNIKDYATVNAMFTALESEDFIAGWDARITYNKGVSLCGNQVIKPGIGLTAPANEIYAGNSMTLTATDATFSLSESIDGVSVDAQTGVLTVGAGVAADTEITVRATSNVVTGVYEEIVITVVFEPVDLSSDGIKDIELGSAISIANVSGDVLSIKTASGSKVVLATPNVITASELNTAAGVNWSEDLAITLYTASNAYSVKAAFITKIIRSIDDLKSVSANKISYETSYLVIGNDIDGTDQESVNTISREINDSLYVSQGFRGVLDGRGHILSNIKLQEGMLFWGIGKNGVVKNLALIDPVQVTARGYCFARDLGNSTISNVFVKASSGAAILQTYKSAVIKDSVFVLESGGQYVCNTVGVWGDRQTTFSNLAIVVGNPTAGTLGNGAESFAGLIGTHYVSGSYADFKVSNNIIEYTSVSAMLSGLTATAFDDWNSPFTFADGKLYFNGKVVLE